MWRLLLSFLLIACGNDDKSTSSPQPTPQSEMYLAGMNGQYASECIPDSQYDRSSRTFIEIGEFRYNNRFIRYSGKTCDDTDKRVTYKKSFHNIARESKPDLEGWETFVIDVDQITATAHSEETRRIFNNDSVYGHNNWQLEEEKNISGKKYSEDSQPELESGAVRVITVQLSEESLRFATYTDGKASSEEVLSYKKI